MEKQCTFWEKTALPGDAHKSFDMFHMCELKEGGREMGQACLLASTHLLPVCGGRQGNPHCSLPMC